MFYNETKEPYYRFGLRLKELIQKRISKPSKENRGRKPPLVIRPSEEIIIPTFNSAYESISYYTMLIYCYPDNDYAISKVLNHILKVARRYQFQGRWEIWFAAAEYFGLTVVDPDENIIKNKKECSYLNYKRIGIDENEIPNYSAEGTIFSDYYWIEFLLGHFSEDDIFGNLIRYASNQYLTVRKRKLVHSYEKDRRIKPLKTSDYKDKGSLPDCFSDVRTKAFRGLPEEPKPKHEYDSLSSVSLWGHEKLNPISIDGGGE